MPPIFSSSKTIFYSKYRFFILVVLILILLILGPILEQFFAIRMVIDIFMTGIILAMLFTITHNKRMLFIRGSLGIIMVVSMWLKHFISYDAFAVTSIIVGILLTGFLTAHTLNFVIRSETVTKEVVYAAILVYLLLAQLWALVYMLLYLIDPASFNLPGGQGDLLIFEYYSFVTLTTLGFGDITPLTKVAKMFSVLAAVVGQLYLVVGVAKFVGMYVARKSSNTNK